MKAFEYAAPESLADGLSALRTARPDRARVLAGGTDLLPLMKAHIESPQVLVNVKRIAELSRDIRVDADGAMIGALTTLADVAGHPELAREYPALSQAALSAATPQLRNMASIGGTLLQRPRCWYFRNEAFHCWLKGGSQCDAREGQNAYHAIFDTGTCRAVHPSDLGCALVALDAEVRTQGARGERSIRLSEFFASPTDERRTETLLAGDELVLDVRIPPNNGARSAFLKAMDRAAWSFATVSVAAVLRLQDEKIAHVEVVLGGVASVPWRVTPAVQPLLGTAPDEAAIAACARAALQDAQPLRMNAYKVVLAQSLIRRALRSLCTGATGTQA